MIPDNFTIKTFYWKALNEYMEACDQMTDLYDLGKTPEVYEFEMATTRLKHSRDKLTFLYNISKNKYGVTLERAPYLLVRGGVA